jgi:hypothetical protein
MNTVVIFALILFVSYHLFLKESFEVQKTNCSLYPIPQLCSQYKNKGCELINTSKIMGEDKCTCTDPSKGCELKL